MKNVFRAMLVAVVMGVAAIALAGPAEATHATLTVVAPERLTAGNSVDIQAVLHSTHGDESVAGATVTFYMDGAFGGVDGEVMLGQAVTDENGVAVLNYEPRTAGEHQLRVEYLTPGESEPEEAAWSHSVGGASGQLYRSTSGVEIPGLDVWLLIAVVATVWAILLSVAVRVIAIAHAGDNGEVGAGRHPGAM